MKPTVLAAGTLLLAGSLALAASTTASAQGFKISKPEIVFDEQVDFSAFRTYAWKDSQEPLPNRANHLALTFAVEEELEAKGLEKAPAAEAELFVRYHVKVEKKTKSTGYSGGPSVDSYNVRTMFRVDKVETGTLILELYEAGTRTLVWQARQSEPIRNKKNAESQIRSLVKRIVAAYPPKPAE